MPISGIDPQGNKVIIKDSERSKCEVWSRVVGYHRPKDSYNFGKRQEFADRKFFEEPK